MNFRGVTMNKATKLSEIQFTCANFALDSDELTKFYVDTSEARGFNMITRLVRHFDYIPHIYQQVLYLGHRGSGKSTILYQLEQKLNDTYEVIRYSVQDCLDIENLTLADLLFSMYEHLFFLYKDIIKDNEEEFEFINTILEQWYSSITVQNETQNKQLFSIDLGTEANTLSKIIKLFGRLNSTFQFNSSEKRIICSNVKNCVGDYIMLFNDLVELVSKKLNKPILFMFEDLEKISEHSAETLFLNEAKFIPKIKVHMLLTTPIYFKYSANFRRIAAQYFPFIERCPMISLTDSEGNINKIGYETMEKIVYARISEELIDKNTLKFAISCSGGVIRDLFSILREASLNSDIDGKSTISMEYVENAFVVFQETFSDIVHGEYIPAIIEIYNKPRGPVTASKELIELMCTEAVIEYNGEQWRGVHPAVLTYLKKIGALKKIIKEDE